MKFFATPEEVKATTDQLNAAQFEANTHQKSYAVSKRLRVMRYQTALAQGFHIAEVCQPIEEVCRPCR